MIEKAAMSKWNNLPIGDHNIRTTRHTKYTLTFDFKYKLLGMQICFASHERAKLLYNDTTKAACL